MKFGGHGELWMVIGPLIALLLIATYAAGGPEDMILMAERFANDAWNAASTALRH